jgi:hypothetical protein
MHPGTASGEIDRVGKSEDVSRMLGTIARANRLELSQAHEGATDEAETRHAPVTVLRARYRRTVPGLAGNLDHWPRAG